jgi:hypothetical protein
MKILQKSSINFAISIVTSVFQNYKAPKLFFVSKIMQLAISELTRIYMVTYTSRTCTNHKAKPRTTQSIVRGNSLN